MAAFRGEMTTAFSPGRRSSGARHQSRRVGPAHDADGGPTMAYQALERLSCGRCGGGIAAGDLSLRRTLLFTAGHGLGLTQAPVCVRCCPLMVTDGGQDDG